MTHTINLDGRPLSEIVREAEAAAIVAAMNATRCSSARAAERLGVSYETLRGKVRKYGITVAAQVTA